MGDTDLGQFGDVHERARENGARDGTPILWSARHGADPWINLFFRADEIVSKQRTTWRRYAYALVVWLNFLEQRGRSAVAEAPAGPGGGEGRPDARGDRGT
ncbi:hypothetical protein AB0F96_35320 [Streptomyces sp. NPDC023998]|uniref:hypothetical protein n=1 Tax=Streptomyces sp. NPDC023998 TaxID=3154597 RepID=UPI0033C5717A